MAAIRPESGEEYADGISASEDQLRNRDFKYPSIDPTTQIRLLRVTHQAGKNLPSANKYKYDLETANVSQLAFTAYIALSYTWGEARTDTDIHLIEIDDQPLWIRTNLFHFLSSVTESGIHLPIYIDAICLDQGNDTEKCHQVQLMSQIYANANTVLAWVGVPHADQHGHLDALSRRLETHDAAESQWDVSEIIGLSYLCSRQFWRRLWVVQELLLAENIIVVCGEWKILWKDVSRLAALPLPTELLDNQEQVEWWQAWKFPCPESFQTQREYEDRLFDGWHSALRLFHHRSKWRLRQKYVPYSDAVRTRGWPFHRAVRDFRLQQCKDRRDKVFALIGLLDEEGRGMITPSYECPMEDLFVQATAAGLVSLRREAAAQLSDVRNMQHRNRRFCDTLNDILGLPEDGREERAKAALDFATFHHSQVVRSYDTEDVVRRGSELLQTGPQFASQDPEAAKFGTMGFCLFVLHAGVSLFSTFGAFIYLVSLRRSKKLELSLKILRSNDLAGVIQLSRKPWYFPGHLEL